jgi:uncharacterized protein (TIGR02391 family)
MAADRKAATGQPSGGEKPIGTPHLHRLIAASSGRQFANGHYDDAVFNAFKAVEDRVKRLSGKSEIGKRLMTYVFNENAPTLDVTSPNADKDQKADEREGYKFLFMGAAHGLRNPRGHGGHLDTPEDEAAEMLAVACLLMRVLDRAEEQLALEPPEPDDGGEWDGDSDDDDQPGSLDLIAALEDSLPGLKATIDAMAVCLEKFGEITAAYTPKVAAAAELPTMSARLAVVQAFANEVKPPTQKFRELAADYVGQMVELSGGIEALTNMRPFADMSIDDQAQFLVLAESIRGLRDGSIGGVGAASSMSQDFQDVAKLSRSLKAPSADLREGVRQMQSVQHYYDEWVDGFRKIGALGDNPA